MIKKAFVAAATLSLAASPVLAQSSIPQPAAETVATSDANLLNGRPGSFVGPLIALLIVLGGILLAIDGDDNDRPVSP